METTNLIADRMRCAMRIDMPEQHKALQAGVEEIEWLWKIAKLLYRCIGRGLVEHGKSYDVTDRAKAAAYDLIRDELYRDVPPPADTDRTIADIRASDAQSAATWFTGKPSATALAIRDRRWLLAEVQRLEAQLAVATELTEFARHLPHCSTLIEREVGAAAANDGPCSCGLFEAFCAWVAIERKEPG